MRVMFYQGVLTSMLLAADQAWAVKTLGSLDQYAAASSIAEEDWYPISVA